MRVVPIVRRPRSVPDGAPGAVRVERGRAGGWLAASRELSGPPALPAHPRAEDVLADRQEAGQAGPADAGVADESGEAGHPLGPSLLGSSSDGPGDTRGVGRPGTWRQSRRHKRARRPATSVDPPRHRSPGPRPRGGSMRGIDTRCGRDAHPGRPTGSPWRRSRGGWGGAAWGGRRGWPAPSRGAWPPPGPGRTGWAPRSSFAAELVVRPGSGTLAQISGGAVASV